MNSTDPGGAAKASAAGIYDAVLGGMNHTDADRAVMERLLELEPQLREASWSNRGFLQRTAAWMAKQGVRRFVDVGAGLPTMSNTHDVVHAIAPQARIVYVDNDPVAVEKGRELLAGVKNVTYIQRDLTDDDLLDEPALAELFGSGEPVGLLLVGLLYFVPDEADPVGLVRRMVDALPSGSYMALSHAISDQNDEDAIRTGTEVYKSQSTAQLVLRTAEEIAGFFQGLEIVPPYDGAEPALTYVGLWGAEDPVAADDDPSRWYIAAVGRRR